jgi:chalcone isomerase
LRGLEIGGNFIKFTAIGVYLEDAAVSALAKKCAGKTADELASDAAFFRDVVTGEWELYWECKRCLVQFLLPPRPAGPTDRPM